MIGEPSHPDLPTSSAEVPGADPDDAAGLPATRCAHATHFLERTLRCEGEDLERAMRLYHHSELMRRIVPTLLAGQGDVRRAAIPLRAEPPSPQVVVSGEGRFITCLEESMTTDLPLIPYAEIEKVMAAEDLRRGRTARAGRQLKELPQRRIARAIAAGYGGVTREMVAVVLLEPLTYVPAVLGLYLEGYRYWVLACQSMRHRRDLRETHRRCLQLEAVCRVCVALMGGMDMEPLTEYLASVLEYSSTLEADIVAALCRHTRGGEALLAAAVSDKVSPRTQEIITGYLTTHCVHFPRHTPALLERVRALPLVDSGVLTEVRALCDEMLAGSAEEMVEAFQLQRAKRLSRPLPASRHFELTESDYFGCLNAYFPVTTLFPPVAVAAGVRAAWERHVRDSPLPPRYRSDIPPVVKAGPRVGRNDPCPCGSGRKQKRCCGSGAPASAAPPAEQPEEQAPAPG